MQKEVNRISTAEASDEAKREDLQDRGGRVITSCAAWEASRNSRLMERERFSMVDRRLRRA